MDLKINGSVTQMLPEQSGEGRNGPWRKQEFILETEGNYPKQICVAQWGDNIDKFAVEVGQQITVHVDIQSREYTGRWYTDVKAWKVERGAGEPGPAGPVPDPFEGPPPRDDDGLPF